MGMHQLGMLEKMIVLKNAPFEGDVLKGGVPAGLCIQDSLAN